MTAAMADTLPATVVEQQYEVGVWPNSCLQSVASVAPTTDHHDAPTLCRRLKPQTCGTLLIQNLCHTCCKQDPRHGIYSKLVTSIWSQQPWQHLYQSSILRSAEKYPRGRNWMQRHREEIIQMSRRGTKREAPCQNCVKWTKTLLCCPI